MKIEVWSDYACPFCYIGKRHLDLALEQFPHKEYVSVRFKSYELDPEAAVDPKKSYHQMLADKFNKSIAEAEEMTSGIATQAATAGLDYQFEEMVSTNTFDAHRLTKFAENSGKGLQMVERLFKAHFTEAEHVGDVESLTKLAVEVGLDKDEVEEFLQSCKGTKRVREEEEQAMQIGVRGVPFFVLNDKYALSGAQPPEAFLQALNQVWDELDEKPTKLPVDEQHASFCKGDENECPKS